MNTPPIMIASLRTRLHDLALLWCCLTGGSPEDFNREFHPQLAALNRFTGRFPDADPADLAAGLTLCIMGCLHVRFSPAEIQQARMRLSQEEPDGAEVGV